MGVFDVCPRGKAFRSLRACCLAPLSSGSSKEPLPPQSTYRAEQPVPSCSLKHHQRQCRGSLRKGPRMEIQQGATPQRVMLTLAGEVGRFSMQVRRAQEGPAPPHTGSPVAKCPRPLT